MDKYFQADDYFVGENLLELEYYFDDSKVSPSRWDNNIVQTNEIFDFSDAIELIYLRVTWDKY